MHTRVGRQRTAFHRGGWSRGILAPAQVIQLLLSVSMALIHAMYPMLTGTDTAPPLTSAATMYAAPLRPEAGFWKTSTLLLALLRNNTLGGGGRVRLE